MRISAHNDDDIWDWFDWFRQPAPNPTPDVQDIREEAAEGIRTLDLLHGKQTL